MKMIRNLWRKFIPTPLRMLIYRIRHPARVVRYWLPENSLRGNLMTFLPPLANLPEGFISFATVDNRARRIVNSSEKKMYRFTPPPG